MDTNKDYEEVFTDPNGNLRVRYRARSKERLNELINDLRDRKQYGPADYDYFELDEFADKLEKFRDQEL